MRTELFLGCGDNWTEFGYNNRCCAFVMTATMPWHAHLTINYTHTSLRRSNYLWLLVSLNVPIKTVRLQEQWVNNSYKGPSTQHPQAYSEWEWSHSFGTNCQMSGYDLREHGRSLLLWQEWNRVHYYWGHLLDYCTSPGWHMTMPVEQLVKWMPGRGKRSTRRKPVPVPFCLPQNSHGLSRARTRVAAVESGTARLLFHCPQRFRRNIRTSTEGSYIFRIICFWHIYDYAAINDHGDAPRWPRDTPLSTKVGTKFRQ
jgi:hypothetical protein